MLDEILCFGWIDGVVRKLDDERTTQLMSPCRTQIWAKTDKDRAARLIVEGRMDASIWITYYSGIETVGAVG